MVKKSLTPVQYCLRQFKLIMSEVAQGVSLDNINELERFSYDLEMKMHEQNRKNNWTEIEPFDWFIERIQRLVASGWLSESSDEKTSCPRTF